MSEVVELLGKIEEASGEEPLVAQPYFGQENYPPAHVLKREEPHHRWICQLAAQGNTMVEIAELTGFSTATISYVKKQPWAQKYIAELQERSGRKAVMAVLTGAAVQAAQTLVDVMNGQGEAKASDRAKAANMILDRAYGQAPQVVMTGKVDPSELSSDELVAIVAGHAA